MTGGKNPAHRAAAALLISCILSAWVPGRAASGAESLEVGARMAGGATPHAAIIGDSLLSGMDRRIEEMLGRDGIRVRVDSRGGRAMRSGWLCTGGKRLVVVHAPQDGCSAEGYQLLREWRDQGALPPVLAVALGTNDIGLPAGARRSLDGLAGIVGERRLVLVTVARRTPITRVRVWNKELRLWCATRPGCSVVEWVQDPQARSRTSYHRDGVHLVPSAQLRRAELIAQAVRRVVLHPANLDRVTRRAGPL